MQKENHTIRFDPQEWKTIESRAKENEITSSEYILRAVEISLKLDKIAEFRTSSGKPIEDQVNDALAMYINRIEPIDRYIRKYSEEDPPAGIPYSP